MTIRSLFTAAAVLLVAAQVSAHEYKAGSIEIDHPWSRATPNGAEVAGGYLSIRNSGAEPDRLVSATAEVAGRVEIHQMTEKDGVMIMRPLPEGVVAPARSEAALAPGGAHLMFLDLKGPLKPGERIPGTLTFEKAGVVTVEFAVEAIGARGPEAAGHHHN